MLLRSYCFVTHLTIIFFTGKVREAAAVIGTQVQPISPADAVQLSFVASLSRNDVESSPEENHFCTGTLISSQMILTAHHCTNEFIDNEVVIRIGCSFQHDCREYDWDTWYSYRNWAVRNNKTVDPENDDIAVVKLTESVSVQPAILKTSANAIRYGSKLYMAGWGDLDDGFGPYYMRKVSVKVLPIEECKERTRDFVPDGFLNWERKICTAIDAETGYALVDDGDSGGPLFDDEYYVVGVNIGRGPVGDTPLDKQINDHCTVKFYREFIKSVMH